MGKVNQIFDRFVEEKVDFCVLRNYAEVEDSKDVDILIGFGDKKKVIKIVKKFGLKKRASFGYYLSCKNDVWFDFKVGGLPYQGFCFEKSCRILDRKRRYGNFFILNEEDEIIHLILHSILDKKYFKKEYLEKIERLLERIDERKVFLKLRGRFGRVGEILFLMIKRKHYESSLGLRKKLLRKMFSLYGLYNFMLLKLIKILR